MAMPVKALSVGLWGLAAPTTIAEMDCYGILVAGSDLAPGVCSLSDSTQVLGNLLAGQFAAGSDGVIEVPAGKGRNLAVFGFVSNSGTCENQFGASFDPAKFSAPMIVGQVTADLSAGDVTVTVPVSMTAAKTIVSCSGNAYGDFPKTPTCTPTLASASYLGQGQIQLTGTCLDQSTGISLVNVTDSLTTATSIISKTATQALVQMTTSLAVSRLKNYQILIATAQAQVATPVNLSVSADLAVYEGSTLLGKYLSGKIKGGVPEGGMMGQPVVFQSGTIPIAYGTNSSLVTSLITSYYRVNTAYSLVNISELQKRNLTYHESSVFFSGTDCDGDAAVYASNTDMVLVKYISAPAGCGTTCTDRYYKVTGAGTWQAADFTSSSYSYYSGSSSGPTTVTCTTTPNTVSNGAYVFPAASLTTVTLGGVESPATVTNLSLRPE